MKVELEQQVIDFVRSLPTEPRQLVRRALKNLQKEEGNISLLEGELDAFYRLRVSRYRIIFRYDIRGRQRTIRCVYAAARSIIYEVFSREIRNLLRRDPAA